MMNPNISVILDERLKGYDWKVLHTWKNHDAYYVVVSTLGDLLFFRGFKRDSTWQLSLDKRMHMYDIYEEIEVDGLPRNFVFDEVKTK